MNHPDVVVHETDGVTPEIDDVYHEIGRQFGTFLRGCERFFADMKSAHSSGLDRAGGMLLGRLVTRGPARLSTLAEDQNLDLSTVSRQVAALEGAGLVARTPDEADRRAWLIAPTEAGIEKHQRARAAWHAELRDLLADWTPAERSEFARLFTSFNEKIAARTGSAVRQENTR